MLVKGPKGHKVTLPDGSRRSVSMMKSTACWSCSAMVGSTITGPSSPVLPCTCSAVTNLRFKGAAQPSNTLVWGLPANSQMISALRVVQFSGTLPATEHMPKTSSSSGLAKANSRAKASSCPGSVSIMILRRWRVMKCSCSRPIQQGRE